MSKELEKNYNPLAVEETTYARWLERQYFSADTDPGKKPYTIVIPPPNITNKLHLGHALNNTIQDILIRTKRMQGYSALWLPGTDHASIATEAKIVDAMAEEGLTKEKIGRDEFMKRAWAWKDKYGSTIVKQLKKLGSSCDWDRERFTLDTGLSDAVSEVFVRLYEKGLIYRGEKLINWCPCCKTSISDAEVDHEEKDGTFYHFRYRIAETGEYLNFVTSRPETILGDTAIAVNPEDERYSGLIGKHVTVPIVDRVIPIIADSYVDKEFGTGVVKITPAHDPNDFEVGERHNLPKINIMNDDGTINANGGKYAGKDRFEARKLIVEEFKSLGLFIKTEPVKHAVGTHERCSTVIEPAIKIQWFVKMEELAKPAVSEYKSGKLKLFPERMGKIYLHWLENIRDWCISRQLWWGHRIPAFYCADCGNIAVSKTEVCVCPKCSSKSMRQDGDTLDTWFSSALWPFSTLGWPEKTADLEYFYPTDVLVTGYDIIFFWVIRMVFSSMEFMGELPFKDVYFTGLVRDEQGRKMSKSLGNGIDPLDIIENYGTDSLRFSLISGTSPGNDMRFYISKVESARNFTNKLWNAARFILMNIGDGNPALNESRLTSADKWILSKVNGLAKEVTDNIEAYELGLAINKVYDFIWDEFCDWYIEMVKPRLYNRDDESADTALWTLKYVLIQALKLLHPFMPFITEELFLSVQSEEETIMLSPWPKFDERFSFKEQENNISLVKDAIKGIRNIRAELNVPPSKKAKLFIVSEDAGIRSVFELEKSYLATLGYASGIEVQADKQGISDDMFAVILPSAAVYMPFTDLVDIGKEIERLTKEKDKLVKEVERVVSKLANQGFVSKAPQTLIDEEKAKQQKYEGMLAEVEKQLLSLSSRQ